MFAAASAVPLSLAILITCFLPEMWFPKDKNDPETWFILLLYIAAMCVLPALCVVVYYQRRKKGMVGNSNAPGVSPSAS